MLVATELGYGVQRPTSGDHVATVGLEPLVEPGRAGARAEVGDDVVVATGGELGVRLEKGHRAPPGTAP